MICFFHQFTCVLKLYLLFLPCHLPYGEALCTTLAQCEHLPIRDMESLCTFRSLAKAILASAYNHGDHELASRQSLVPVVNKSDHITTE